MQTPLRVRAATLDDRNFIIELVPRFFELAVPPERNMKQVIPAIEQELFQALVTPSPGTVFLLAENAIGTPLGFIYLKIVTDFLTRERQAHISDLAVAETAEGQGVGRALMQAAEAWAKAQKCRTLTLSTLYGNTKARSFYERLGYQEDTVNYIKSIL